MQDFWLNFIMAESKLWLHRGRIEGVIAAESKTFDSPSSRLNWNFNLVAAKSKDNRVKDFMTQLHRGRIGDVVAAKSKTFRLNFIIAEVKCI